MPPGEIAASVYRRYRSQVSPRLDAIPANGPNVPPKSTLPQPLLRSPPLSAVRNASCRNMYRTIPISIEPITARGMLRDGLRLSPASWMACSKPR